MKKRVLALFMATVMCVSLVGCGKKKESDAVKVETPESVTEDSAAEESVIEEEPEEEEPEFVSQMGYNLIENGDLSQPIDEQWYFYTNGGKGSLEWKDEQLVVNIQDNGKVEHGVQIYYDGFAVNQGSVYELSFDVSSTIERQIDCRIQKNGGDYHAYKLETLDLTPDTQHVDIEFTMEETSDPAPRFCFNMGFTEESKSYSDHTITFDNFELYCIDETNTVKGGSEVDTPDIQINQIGYRPGDDKIAVFTGKNIDSSFSVVNVDTKEVVFEGTITDPVMNDNTGRKEATGDFSSLKDKGTYKVVSDKCGESYEFKIADDVYDEVFKDTLKMYYLQRCGMELTDDYAGDYAHKACHTEKATIYGTSKTIDVSGGWHDAGDYGKYVVAGAKAAGDLMLAYEVYPSAFDDAVGIPESGNGTPDVLDEVRYELEWMLKMQDSDGGVYHKVTCAVFPEACMPEEETDELIVCPKSTCATADFAAVMAMAGRVYADVDADFAGTCLDAAAEAYEYLDSHDGGDGFTNPDGVVTGEYPDKYDIDERLWAAAELFKTTGDSTYGDDAAEILETYGKEVVVDENGEELDGPSLGWAEVGIYGAYAYASSQNTDKAALGNAKALLTTFSKEVVDNAGKDSYQAGIYEKYEWGSNSTIANASMGLLLDKKVNGNNYENIAKAQVDYLFGNNGTSYCYLTGYGSLNPVSTHHRPSQATGKTMKGMLVGGPNANLDDPYAQAVLADKAPALCYVDNEQSYSCNEITIYWNSPLVFSLAGVLSK